MLTLTSDTGSPIVSIPMADLDAVAITTRLRDIAAQLGSAPHALECARVLSRAVDDLHTGRPLIDVERIREYALAFQDGGLIVDAFDALTGQLEVPGALDRLREAVLAEVLAVPVEGNDESRNHLWAAFVAARLHQGGLTPQFVDGIDKSPDKKPDLLVTVDGSTLAVEAKRVRSQSRSKLRSRVRKSVEQILTFCDANKATAGLIALDVSFARDQHAQKGIWRIPERGSIGSVFTALRPTLRNLLEDVREIVRSEVGAHHVAGATLMVQPVVHYADQQRLGLVRIFATAEFPDGRSKAGINALKTVAARCFAADLSAPSEV